MTRFEYDDLGNVIDHEPRAPVEHHGNCLCCGKPLPTTFEEERDQLREANAWSGRMLGIASLLLMVAGVLWRLVS